MSGADVSIRIWRGVRVCMLLTVGADGNSSMGAVGGAGNSTQVDIELDPWAGLITDNRADHPVPVSIVEDLSGEES
jgi:hypothetical protein